MIRAPNISKPTNNPPNQKLAPQKSTQHMEVLIIFIILLPLLVALSDR